MEKRIKLLRNTSYYIIAPEADSGAASRSIPPINARKGSACAVPVGTVPEAIVAPSPFIPLDPGSRCTPALGFYEIPNPEALGTVS